MQLAQSDFDKQNLRKELDKERLEKQTLERQKE